MTERPSLVWVRRDFRLADNPALTAASGRPVIPVFIHEPEPAAWADGPAARWWLRRGLAAFRRRLESIGGMLVERHGPPAAVLVELARETGADTVLWNRRYAPAQQAVDAAVAEALQASGLAVRTYSGGLLFEPPGFRGPGGQPYQIFAAFWKACLAQGEPAAPLPEPVRLLAPAARPADRPPPPATDAGAEAAGWETAWPMDADDAGDLQAQERLHDFITGVLARYAVSRDLPDQTGTSLLSPHLAFGEITPRQIWQAVRTATGGGGDVFLRELAWREFSWATLHHAPHLPEQPLRRQFADFPWMPDPELFAAWTEGRTGYPIVDAGMRALAATGWMHNRVRMIVASFLVKDLLIPWQQGEAWFWDRLVDADLACNAGNWQWVAGCGLDAAPYFRIFNPVLQGEKFDARGRYVRQWVPELAGLPDMFIHRPTQAPADVLARAGVRLGVSYPLPLVDHGAARRRALAAYEQTRGAA